MPNITYLRNTKGQSADLIDFDSDSSNSGSSETSWWRIGWHEHETVQGVANFNSFQASKQRDVNDPPTPYTVRMVTEQEVLAAARMENDSVILVYAHEEALNFDASPLNPALAHFVEQDNWAFREELQEGRGRGRRRGSQETSTTIMEDVPLGSDRGAVGSSPRELTPISNGSPVRRPGDHHLSEKDQDEAYYLSSSAPEYNDDPPPYAHDLRNPDIPEKRGNKIGLLADQMLEKYSDDGTWQRRSPEDDGPLHIEHPHDSLR